MFPLKTLAYMGLFGLAMLGCIFYHPIVGIYAYLTTYNINPMGQWWGGFLPGIFQRYSFLLAIAIAIGIVVHHAKLRYGRFMLSQEVIFLLFLGAIWLTVLVGQGVGIHYNTTKMAKVFLILFMASRVITSKKYFEGMLWVFILSGLYLSYELYSGGGVMHRGRFHGGVGGSDFSEGNFLAAHFGFILPFIGILFLKHGWKLKALCLVSGVFILNSIIWTRSRGIFIALAIGAVATLWYTLKLHNHRKKIIALALIGILGGLYLTDPGFWDRVSTLSTDQQELDRSAQGRLEAWRGAWEMVQDFPLGVGVNQSFSWIGFYAPAMQDKDIHNTYLRCLAELGFLGLFLLLLLIFNAFRMLRNTKYNALILPPSNRNDFHLYIFATRIALVIYLSAAMFISSVYIEELYWLLMMPVFIQRALENEIEDSKAQGALAGWEAGHHS